MDINQIEVNMSQSSEMFLQIQEELSQTKNACIEGELSNLDALIEMHKAKQKAEQILKIVKDFEDERINEISNEAESYKGIYRGFEIKSVNGRKMYSFKGIEAIQEVEQTKKELEKKYVSAFEGFQKGVVQTTEVDGIRYWIDENSELQLFPEFSVGKSYLTVKLKK